MHLFNEDNATYVLTSTGPHEYHTEVFDLEQHWGWGWFFHEPGNYTVCFGNYTSCDGMNDTLEFHVSEGWEGYNTDPNASDSDGDGLNDGDEVNTYNTNPNDWDTDWDGLNDDKEINHYGTNPNNPDTDEDGLDDFTEIDMELDLGEYSELDNELGIWEPPLRNE